MSLGPNHFNPQSRNSFVVPAVQTPGAEEHASLLSDWKPMVPVTNLSSRKLQGRMKGCADHGTDGHGSIGIAAVNTLL